MLMKILMFNIMLVVSDLRKAIFLSNEITVNIKMLFVLEAKYVRLVRVPSNPLSFSLEIFHFTL